MATNSRLFMEIGFINSEFQAIDRTPYERWIDEGVFDDSHKHLVLQRLTKMNDNEDPTVIGSTSIKATDEISEIRDSFVRSNLSNGLYYYQKMLIPDQNHVTTANQRLYFNDDDLSVHYVDTDSGIELTLHPINDFERIYNILTKECPDNCFCFDEYSFTIYNLVQCYVMLERERINNFLKNNCREACNNNNDTELKTDLILAAITVINSLIDNKDFFEAQRIVNGLSTCNGLCPKVNKTLNGCGCGGI